ncbi:MAG: hypothetical protein DCF21_00485 [Leptolyngbya sp.]|nr:MAG: hypothetical protein DCF21_00485 [Leptolyngbya sp.]
MSLENLARNDQRYIDRHLWGTQQMQRELSRTGSAHVFVDEAMLRWVEQKLLQNVIFTGRVRGADRYGYLFNDVIGYKIDLKGSEIPPCYGELKVKDGRYHAIPRTKASY